MAEPRVDVIRIRRAATEIVSILCAFGRKAARMLERLGRRSISAKTNRVIHESENCFVHSLRIPRVATAGIGRATA